jgi:hypothetical protein
LPVPRGRGGYETDGAMFVSRITGINAGLAAPLGAPAKITIVTVREFQILDVPYA